jgi:hypothetical protein
LAAAQLRGGGGWRVKKNAVGDCWVEPESHTFHYRNAVGNIGGAFKLGAG